jgi:glycosyltransferase involved in cell wall biosynthesis
MQLYAGSTSPPDVTICIPTFERPESLALTLESVRWFAPAVSVLVCDFGREKSASKVCSSYGVRRIAAEYDIGTGPAKNLMARSVDTPFIFYMDDDMDFTARTRLSRLRELFLKHNLDIMSCALWFLGYAKPKRTKWVGLLEKRGTTLYRVKKEHRELFEFRVFRLDCVMGHFLARTEVMRKHPFSPELPQAELLEFFWRLKKNNVRVGFTGLYELNHRVAGDARYRELRDRREESLPTRLRLLGVKRIRRVRKLRDLPRR